MCTNEYVHEMNVGSHIGSSDIRLNSNAKLIMKMVEPNSSKCLVKMSTSCEFVSKNLMSQSSL